MSPINSALQYKIQKMERQLSSLMEENHALRTIINEADVAGMSPTAAFNYGGGAALGQNLAMKPQVGFGGAGKFAGGMSPTSTSTGGGLMSGGVGSFAQRSAQTGGGGQPPFDGAMLGNLLAQAGQDGGAAAANYLAQYGVNIPSVTGAQTASDRRRTNPLATRR